MTGIVLGAKVFLMTPSFLVGSVGSSGWITALVGTALAFGGLLGWLEWSKATAGLAMVPALRKTLGRLLGDLVASIIMIATLVGLALNLRVMAGGVVIGLLPQFPAEVIVVVALLSGLYAAWLGLETVARVTVLFTPLTALSLVVVIVGADRLIDSRNLFPFWGLGVRETLTEGFFSTGLFAVLPGLLVWKSYVRDQKILSQGVSGGVFLAGLSVALGTAVATAAFPYPEVSRIIDSLGILARAVYLGAFLQRLEAVFTFVWYFTSSVQTSVLFSIILLLLSQLAGTYTYKPFTAGVALLTFAGAVLPPSILSVGQALHGGLFRELGVGLVAFGWVLFLVAKLRHVTTEGDNEASEPSGSGSAHKTQEEAPCESDGN